jgi:hypothetical protein
MNLEDAGILVKKILVGIAVFLVPLAVIAGGLWVISHYITK